MQNRSANPEVTFLRRQFTMMTFKTGEVEDTSMVPVCQVRTQWFGGHNNYRSAEQLDHWVIAVHTLDQSCRAHI